MDIMRIEVYKLGCRLAGCYRMFANRHCCMWHTFTVPPRT